MRMSAFQERAPSASSPRIPAPICSRRATCRFGWGFGKLPESLSSDACIERYLAAPLTIYLGTADDHPDEDLDMSAESVKQGGGRYQRGKAAFALGEQVAREHGWRFAWKLVRSRRRAARSREDVRASAVRSGAVRRALALTSHAHLDESISFTEPSRSWSRSSS
jgi:hypothetical protein